MFTAIRCTDILNQVFLQESNNNKFIKIMDTVNNEEILSIESQDIEKTCLITETEKLWIFSGYMQITLVDKK